MTPEEIRVREKLRAHDADKPLRGTVEYSQWLSDRISLLDELAEVQHSAARALGNSGMC